MSQENRFLGQYLVPANGGVQDKLYETNKTDISEKRDFDNEILRWQTKWSHSTDEKPVTLTQTLQHANPDLYHNVVTIITILLIMPVSTATQTIFHDENRATHSTSPDACLQRHTHWCRSGDSRIFTKKNRSLAFKFLWVPPRFHICLQLMCR